MAAPELGPWEPLPVAALASLFVAYPGRWWVSGGRALELHLGRTWREHEDTDVGVLRAEVAGLPAVLSDWEIWVAARGRLRQWGGEPLDPDRAENNLWCRPAHDRAWALDLTVNEGDADGWTFRRHPALRVRWPAAV